MSSILFTPMKIGSIVAKNRFIRSSTWENFADSNGMPTPPLFSMLKTLADYEVGTIIPGYVYPDKSVISYTGQTGMCDLKHAEVWKPTIDYIHSKRSKLFFQVCHCGSRASPDLIKRTPTGASGIRPGSRAMTNAEIEDSIQQFVNCAKLIEKTGADGLQLSAGHGYLLSEFLSPFYNRRQDKWGQDRLRIVKEVVTEIRKVSSLPILMKINGHDCIDGGVTPDLCASYISRLPEVDLFEISCGVFNLMTTIRSDINQQSLFRGTKLEERETLLKIATSGEKGFEYEEGYNMKYAKIIRQKVPSAKLSVVGGNRDFKKMEQAVTSGITNFISMSRPFIQQPRLLLDYQENLTMKSSCISCGECIIKADDKVVRCRFPTFK